MSRRADPAPAGRRITEALELRGGANHLADEAAPIGARTVAVTAAGVYDVPGRAAQAGFEARSRGDGR